MDVIELGDVELTYRLHEGDQPVVLVHASAFVSWYQPLIAEMPESSTLHYRRRLHRAGDGGYRRLTVSEDAAICARLMDHVGWETAHVVGHSYGALVALQLAVEAPERVASVALLEPAARGITSSEAVAVALEPVIAAYRAGDSEGAVDGFLRHVCGDDYRAVLDEIMPDAFAEALGEADLFFQAEMPAVEQWTFGPGEAGLGDPARAQRAGRRDRRSFRRGRRAAAVLVPAWRNASPCPAPGTSSWCRTPGRWPAV